MDDQEEKTETKELDETKDTKTETTLEDTVIEEALMEEKGMRPETKTALGALTLIVLSMFNIWLVAFDSGLRSLGVILVLFFGGISISCIASSIVTVIVVESREIRRNLTIILWLTYVIPVFMIFPLSKYHNQNQIKRDTIISEAHLQIKTLEDGIEILLPSEHASDNSYLGKVFSLSWTTDKKQAWEDIMIPCREGDKYWYKVKLPFPLWYKWKLAGIPPTALLAEEDKKKYESNIATDNIVLFFDHVWEDYETTKEILLPDPNALSIKK